MAIYFQSKGIRIHLKKCVILIGLTNDLKRAPTLLRVACISVTVWAENPAKFFEKCKVLYKNQFYLSFCIG